MLLLNPIKLCRYYPGDHPRGESVSRWGRATPVNTSDSDARVCKTRPYDMIERI